MEKQTVQDTQQEHKNNIPYQIKGSRYKVEKG